MTDCKVSSKIHLVGPNRRFATSNAEKQFFVFLWHQKCHSEGHGKHIPTKYLFSSRKWLDFFQQQKNSFEALVSEIFFCGKDFMFMNSCFSDFKCLELNFKRNRDQEWACFE